MAKVKKFQHARCVFDAFMNVLSSSSSINNYEKINLITVWSSEVGEFSAVCVFCDQRGHFYGEMPNPGKSLARGREGKAAPKVIHSNRSCQI